MQFFRHERGIRALSRAASRGPVPARPAGPVVLMRLASQDGVAQSLAAYSLSG